MSTTTRIPATAAKCGTGATSVHKFKFGVGAAGAVTAATLKQAGDGAVRSVTYVATGRYTITLNSPAVVDIINCKVTYAKAAQTDAEVFGHYKVSSLTTGSLGTAQTFEIFFADVANAAAEVPSGGEVMVEFTEVLNKSLNARVDN